jgi:tryptophanyl-tRNA synthetase
MSEKIIFSGIQPTGDLHIGNYFGAVQNWARLQNEGEYKCIYCVVDLHAMTMPYNPTELKKNTENLYIDLLASGLNPQKSTVFIQSMVPEHTELTWIFACVCSYGDLTRQAQFKDKSEQLEGKQDAYISAGLFTYPVLQAADILLYRAGYVPVGKDQEQHLELSREIVRRFTSTFGEYFPEPAVLSTETPKLLSFADPTKKMGKSYGEKHIVPLFAEETIVRARVRSAVTDTGEAGTEIGAGALNLLATLRACGQAEQAAAFEREYASGNQRRYAPLKDAVADAVVALTSSLRQRRAEIAADKEALRKSMWDSAQQAREMAVQTIKDVRRMVGLPKR